MKIAITGASGFIGRHFLARLRSIPGMELLAISGSDEGEDRLQRMYPGITVVRSTRKNGVPMGTLSGVDVLVHLAWASVPATAATDPMLDMASNLPPGIALIEAAAKAGVRRMVFLSSGGTVYGQATHLPIAEGHPLLPVSAYGITKLLMEHYLRTLAPHRGLEHVVLRPANVYGDTQPRQRPQGVVEHWMASLLRNELPQVWGSTEVVRDYLHISDMVDVLIAALDQIPSGSTLNVGTGMGTSLADLAAAICRVAGRPLRLEQVAAGPPLIASNVLDAHALEAIIGPRQWMALEDGLARTWADLLKAG